MLFVVVRVDVVLRWFVDCCDCVRCLHVKFREASLVLNDTVKFDGQVWRVLLPSMASRPNTALVMNVFTKQVKCCPAFPSPDESAADWAKDSNGDYTVKVEG